MDAVRTAKRLGAKKVSIVYRRRVADMTALPAEIEGAIAEGIEVQTLKAPASLDIDENQIIRDVKFKTFGCGAAVATSSMATELVKGKTIQEALEVTNKAVMEALDGLPPVKVHCSLLAEEAIHAALWDYAEKHHIKIEGLSKPKSDISEGETEEEEY